MSRAFFISIVLHTLAIAAILYFFKETELYSSNPIKKISLQSIKILKPKAQSKKLKAESKVESLEPRAKSEEKLKAESFKSKVRSLKQKANGSETLVSPKKIKILKHKSKAKSLELRAKSKKKHKTKSHKKAKSQELRAKSEKKFKAKSLKHKAKSGKIKAKSFKHKAKGNKRKTSNQLPVTNNQSLITNHKSLITPSPNIKAQIYQAINQAKVYPRLAKKMNLQGSVYTCFTLGPGGNVSNITTSGAHTILQQGARKTINRAKYSFPSVPNRINICISINFILE